MLVIAALLAALVWDGKDRNVLAGLALGIALTKVIIAGPFLLPFIIKRRWKTLFFAGIYIVIASLLIWPMSKTNPLEMLLQMCSTSVSFGSRGGHDLIVLFTQFGLPVAAAMILTALVSVAIFTPLLFLWRRADMLFQFGVTAVLSRIWTTHSHCDNLVLIFLMIALARQAFQTRNRWSITGFALMGLSLWPPAKCCDVAAYVAFQFFAWIACLTLLLTLQPRNSPLGESQAPDPTILGQKSK